MYVVRLKNRNSLRLLVFLLAILASCKTTPQIPDAVQSEPGFVPLEPGASAYIFADVKTARPVLELLAMHELDGRQTRDMLDLTQSVVIALYPPGNERRLQLAAWGSYPSFQAGLVFASSKDWKKQRSAAGLPYWYSAQSGLSIALNPKQAFIQVSLRDIPGGPFAASPGVEVPAGFSTFRKNAALACWFDNPAPVINQKLREMGAPLELPAERIFISLFPAGEQAESGGQRYEALVQIQTASAVQAKALSTLFTLAKKILPEEISGGASPLTILFSNPPAADGRNLNVKTAPLSEKELALLFTFFSLY